MMIFMILATLLIIATLIAFTFMFFWAVLSDDVDIFATTIIFISLIAMFVIAFCIFIL